jgi:hypothetical protein
VDIVAVGYYGNWPAGLCPRGDRQAEGLRGQRRQPVLRFARLGLEHYGQYKQDSTLVYEKNFASYAILNAFGINLNRDFFGVSDPYDLTSNLITNCVSKERSTFLFLS